MNLEELRDMHSNLKNIIFKHESLRDTLFSIPSATAKGRRMREERNNVIYSNSRYAIQCNCYYRESSRRCYYTGEFFVEGRKVKINTIKNIVKALNCII